MDFQNWPIRKKIIFLMVSISGSATLIASIIFACLEICVIQQEMVDKLTVLSRVMAKNSTAAISFSDSRSAGELLQGLSVDPEIVTAAIVDAGGSLFAHYGRTDFLHNLDERIESVPGHEFTRGDDAFWLDVMYPITIGDRRVGTFFVRSTIDKLIRHIEYCLIALVLTLLLVVGVVYLVSRRLQAIILSPVAWLTRIARQISLSGNYGLRVPKRTNDEIGRLVDDFNTMLNVIQERDRELNDHRNQLEATVDERTAELKLKRDEALASARAKSQFLANMSHEIRTPMNGVIGMLSLLDSRQLDSQQKEFLSAASNSANALMTIIDDILDFSKIEAGKVVFENIEFDVRNLTEDIATLFASAASEKTLDLACFVASDIHSSIKGDPTRLRQVISNLVSNALKFTDQGEVVLSVTEVNRTDSQVSLRFSIRDTGPGISESNLSSIFESFTQADGSTTRRFGGSGLGLTVSKQLIELMGGEIGINSRENAGTEFFFTLQFERGRGVLPHFPDSAAFRGRRVMIVDDNHTNSVILREYLKPLGIDPAMSLSATDALQQIRQAQSQETPFDLLLLDFHMPGMDGLQLAREVQNDPALTTPYMVMLSSGDVSRDEISDAGIRNCLLKPFRQNQLYELLMNYSREHRLSDRNPCRQSEQRLSGEVLVVDDERVNQMVACAMLELTGVRPTVADNGEAALKLFRENHYDLVFMDCHMPVMNGYDTARTIREIEIATGARRTPVIAMTANAMKGAREECLAAGMDEYMSKPIQKAVLVEVLQQWLPSSSSCAIDPAGDIPAQIVEISGLWDRAMTLKQLSDDEQMLGELIDLFRERCPEQLNRIFEAIEQANAEALVEAAHAYKGAVGHFFAADIKDLASELEMKGKHNTLEGARELFAQLESKSSQLLDSLVVEPS